MRSSAYAPASSRLIVVHLSQRKQAHHACQST